MGVMPYPGQAIPTQFTGSGRTREMQCEACRQQQASPGQPMTPGTLVNHQAPDTKYNNPSDP